MMLFRYTLDKEVARAILSRNRLGIYWVALIAIALSVVVSLTIPGALQWTLAIFALLLLVLILDYLRTVHRMHIGRFGSCESELTQAVRTADALNADDVFQDID